EDGQAVAGEHDFGAEGRHFTQAGGPLARVALHLLGIAGVGDCPDEEVAGGEQLALGHPGPGGVFGLAAVVPQLKREVTGAEAHAVLVGDVRVAVLGGPLEVGRIDGELAAVDGDVPAEGALVAVEVPVQVFVPVHQGAGPAVFLRV